MIIQILSVYTFLAAGAAFILLKALHNRYGTGIANIPGPLLASLTDLRRLIVVWRRRPEVIFVRLHDKYGSLVRLGPRAVSVSDPAVLKIIYAPNSGFVKSDFYPVQQSVAKGKRLQGLFNTTDDKFHAKLRRAVSNAYSMTTLVQFEPLVDSTIKVFMQQIDLRFAGQNGANRLCDFGQWLQFYAFDVIGELTFSKRLGFLESGEDVEGIIGNIESALDYFAVVGQIPWLDNCLLKNPIRLWLSDIGLLSGNTAVVDFARSRMINRLSGKVTSIQGPDFEKHIDGFSQRDFLSRFLGAGTKDPAFINDKLVLSLTVSNVFAGSDTTAISLRAIFYYLLKNPVEYKRLMDEFRDAEASGHFRDPDRSITWEEVHNLPFLSSVIKEALRLHPAVGLPLERVVPPEGVTLDGKFLPGGTIVGASAWVIHRSEEIFGHAPEEFLPRRWLDGTEQQLAQMNSMSFAFGMGARTCIGKNISLLEMYKLVPAIFRRYELVFPDKDAEWRLHNAWFVKQDKFYLYIRRRARPWLDG